jgi:hypothetical protein
MTNQEAYEMIQSFIEKLPSEVDKTKAILNKFNNHEVVAQWLLSAMCKGDTPNTTRYGVSPHNLNITDQYKNWLYDMYERLVRQRTGGYYYG